MAETTEDAKLEQDFSELQTVEDKIKKLTDEQEEKMVELDKEYGKKKRPLYDDRTKICARIPNFWLNALLNHRELQYYISTSDYDCLRHLRVLDVKEIEEEGYQGTRYCFEFDKNPFFDNAEIFKEFKYKKDNGELQVNQSTIKWKDGMDLTQDDDEDGDEDDEDVVEVDDEDDPRPSARKPDASRGLQEGDEEDGEDEV